MKRGLIHTGLLGLLGVFFGAAARLLDIYTQNLGNLFSELSIWVLIGVVIALYSTSPRRAAVHILLFCAGMLAAYYTVAAWTNGVYGAAFIFGWSLFALAAAPLGWIAWHAGERTWTAHLIGAGIVAVELAASAVLFDGPGLADWLIAAATAYLVFFRKPRRRGK